MKRSLFDTLLSFLLGFAWGLLFLGSWLVFKITSFFGLPLAFFLTIVFIFLILFAILVLEALYAYKERAEMQKEQLRILQQISDRLTGGE